MGAFTETVEHWVSEFVTSTQGERVARDFGERAGVVLVSFLDNACGSQVAPEDIGESNIVDGVAIGLGRLQLTDAEREKAPELLEGFLAYLESSGRLGGGEDLGRHARHTATAHLLKKQQRRSTIKIGPNDPCPCGSGKKYKKCCMNL